MAHLPWTQQRQGRVKRRHRIPPCPWGIHPHFGNLHTKLQPSPVHGLCFSLYTISFRNFIHVERCNPPKGHWSPNPHFLSCPESSVADPHVQMSAEHPCLGFHGHLKLASSTAKVHIPLQLLPAQGFLFLSVTPTLSESHMFKNYSHHSFYLITKLCQFFLHSGSHLISSPTPASLLAKTSSPDSYKSFPASVLFCSNTVPWFFPNISQGFYLLSLTPNDVLGFFAFLSPASVLHYTLFSLCTLSSARVLTTPLSCDSHP